MSYHLSRLGCEHIVVERERVAERWHTQRWDSLMFQFPNWSIELPGRSYGGTDPEGFSHRSDIIAFIEDYAAWIRAPLRNGFAVESLRPASHRGAYRVSATAGTFEAQNVVVATGPYQRPRVPALASGVPPHVLQIHAGDYRHPQGLPPGAVLVVGSGASGCQIAEELLVAGRRVYFAIGRHRRIPRRHRGQDMFWWRRTLGHLDQKAEDTPGALRQPPPLVTGVGGGHDVDLRGYAGDGMTLLGHIREIRDGRIHLADDLEASLASGDRAFDDFTTAVDAYVREHGIDAPKAQASLPPRPMLASIDAIDIVAADIRTIVWATGYRRDFGWIGLPVLDAGGEPVQRRGVTSAPGVYVLGLAWMHKVKSSFLYGVGEDAEYLAERIARRRRASAAARARGG